jgi:hypothetical protein
LQRLRRTVSTSAASDPLAGYAPTCDDPLAGYAPSPAAPPPKHVPPPASEFADLILLFRRRRDEIAQDQSIPDSADLQAFRIVVGAYSRRYQCTTAEAAKVLRPLTGVAIAAG